jgi:hypothetical protein
MFYLDHPDFTLIPPRPDVVLARKRDGHANAGAWRGVAKTQEGFYALLALWGTPQDDPDHPLCVFSWQPTPEALEALRPFYTTTQAIPFPHEADHRAQWQAQKNEAWLTPFPAGLYPFDVDVPHKGKGVLWAHCPGPNADPVLSLTLEGSTVSRFQEGAFRDLSLHDALFAPKTHTASVEVMMFDTDFTPRRYVPISLILADPAAFGAWAKATLPARLLLPWQTTLGQAYATARTGEVKASFFGETAPWARPMFERTVRAFFENTDPTVVFDGLRNLPGALFSRFRAIARTYDLDTQRRAWRQTFQHKTTSDDLFVMTAPHLAAEKVIASVFKRKRPLSCVVMWSPLRHALESEDTLFFEGLRNATVTHKGVHTLAHVREALCRFEEGWKDVYRLWDRFEGFQKWTAQASPEEAHAGLVQYVASLVSMEAPFSKKATLSPSMRAAFEDPRFLTALENTSFWTRLENAPTRHPEWESLLEQRLLQGMTNPRSSSTSTSSQRPA